MVKTCVKGTWVHQVSEPQLLDSPQSLKIRMLDDLKYQIIWDGDKPIQWIVDYFIFIDQYKIEVIRVLVLNCLI